MGSINQGSYDFMVVGAGPAGTMAATRLADTPQRPSVLLLEAGGRNDAKTARVDGERWTTLMNPLQNYGYTTVPQRGLNDKSLGYDRGKGLGGSSSINFSCWTIGSSGDHNEMARVIGDDEWKWANAQKRYKRIETYHGSSTDLPSGMEKYVAPNSEGHGQKGPIKVGFPTVWEKSSIGLVDACYKAGIPSNLDSNSGNPIGLGIGVNTAYKGVRSTAADALEGAPANLEVLTDFQIARVIFDGNRAAGIETTDGSRFFARKEIVLSCGALDTPRVLMHSGVGPTDQLEKHGIPLVYANDHVGQHLKDHHHVQLSYGRAENTSKRRPFYKDKALQDEARRQWEKDQTGLLATLGTNLGIGFLKLDGIEETPEFKSLPQSTQNWFRQPTVPNWEFIVNGPSISYFIDPENTPAMTTVFAILLNEQSEGSVTLQSSDPSSPLLFDPNFFSHPYDKKCAVELTRSMLKTVNHPAFSKDTTSVISAPKSESEEDILDFWKQDTGSTWHMTGTARMGKSADDAVVDKNFKVFGVEGLRVADMSIYPIMPK